jgi:hypothetical protein
MGINMGLRVKHYIEERGYGDVPPIPIADEVETAFFAYLREKLPSTEPTFGGGWVICHRKSANNADGWRELWDLWDFDVRPFARGEGLHLYGYSEHDLYAAMMGFVMQHFGVFADLEIEPYYSL